MSKLLCATPNIDICMTVFIFIYKWQYDKKLFDELLLKLEMTMISQYSGSGLVPSGSKQLPEPTSTESRYMASPGHIVV